MNKRRRFLKGSLGLSVAGASIASGITGCRQADKGRLQPSSYEPSERLQKFQEILKKPVLKKELIKAPVIIQSVEIFQNGKHYFTKVTSKNGAVGISSGNPKYIQSLYPLMIKRIAKWLVNEDARNLDSLIEKVYFRDLNYKWQGLAFWVGLAYIELAILDMLGNVSGESIGNLLGGRVRDRVSIYYASGNRGNTPGEEVDHLKKLIERSGAKAVKYRLGARMTYNDDSTKRDKALIPLVRKELGENTTIYTDANGSYDVPMGIEIGKILETYQTDFFEEPCRFDHYEETKAVADALSLPIAGGEEETSMRQFMWLMDHGVLSVVQPDLLFFGGLIRSVKIARMAASIGINCTPHISGSALGFLYMMQFASCVKNIGPYQEFKGNTDNVPVTAADSSLQPEDGVIAIPKGPGLGVIFEPSFISGARKILTI